MGIFNRKQQENKNNESLKKTSEYVSLTDLINDNSSISNGIITISNSKDKDVKIFINNNKITGIIDPNYHFSVSERMYWSPNIDESTQGNIAEESSDEDDSANFEKLVSKFPKQKNDFKQYFNSYAIEAFLRTSKNFDLQSKISFDKDPDKDLNYMDVPLKKFEEFISSHKKKEAKFLTSLEMDQNTDLDNVFLKLNEEKIPGKYSKDDIYRFIFGAAANHADMATVKALSGGFVWGEVLESLFNLISNSKIIDIEDKTSQGDIKMQLKDDGNQEESDFLVDRDIVLPDESDDDTKPHEENNEEPEEIDFSAPLLGDLNDDATEPETEEEAPDEDKSQENSDLDESDFSFGDLDVDIPETKEPGENKTSTELDYNNSNNDVQENLFDPSELPVKEEEVENQEDKDKEEPETIDFNFSLDNDDNAEEKTEKTAYQASVEEDEENINAKADDPFNVSGQEKEEVPVKDSSFAIEEDVANKDTIINDSDFEKIQESAFRLIHGFENVLNDDDFNKVKKLLKQNSLLELELLIADKVTNDNNNDYLNKLRKVYNENDNSTESLFASSNIDDRKILLNARRKFVLNNILTFIPNNSDDNSVMMRDEIESKITETADFESSIANYDNHSHSNGSDKSIIYNALVERSGLNPIKDLENIVSEEDRDISKNIDMQEFLESDEPIVNKDKVDDFIKLSNPPIVEETENDTAVVDKDKTVEDKDEEPETIEFNPSYMHNTPEIQTDTDTSKESVSDNETDDDLKEGEDDEEKSSEIEVESSEDDSNVKEEDSVENESEEEKVDNTSKEDDNTVSPLGNSIVLENENLEF